jgi:hypothetical protein
MMPALMGLPAKAKAIYDHLTNYLPSTRAAKIDNLDAAISSRAVASTALSNATWTGALAAILGNTIQTTVIASIQTGYVTVPSPLAGSGEDAYYGDVTITGVSSTQKCVVLYQDYNGGSTARLTSTTNLRISRQATATFRGRWTVIEFK